MRNFPIESSSLSLIPSSADDSCFIPMLLIYAELFTLILKRGICSVEFWALAFQYQEDVFWDFAMNDDSMELKETCFLPTREMAENFIEEELNVAYVLVKIELERVERNGVWSYSRGPVQRWDEKI
jgi:hypothetical protein